MGVFSEIDTWTIFVLVRKVEQYWTIFRLVREVLLTGNWDMNMIFWTDWTNWQLACDVGEMVSSPYQETRKILHLHLLSLNLIFRIDGFLWNKKKTSSKWRKGLTDPQNHFTDHSLFLTIILRQQKTRNLDWLNCFHRHLLSN